MVHLNDLKQRLAAAQLDLTDIEVRHARELRVSVPREQLTSLADLLRDEYHARPELILAEDTRSEGDGFTLRYIFALGSAAELVVASVTIPAADQTFPSLATRWYLASRFEREIHDLFGLVRPDIPICAVCRCTNFGRPITIRC